MQIVSRIVEEDPDLFEPFGGGQTEFLDDYDHRYVAFVAGWGSGKTWAGARKLVNLHLFNAFDGRGRPTGVKGLAIAPTYQLASSVLIPALRQALLEAGVCHRFISDPRQFCFVLPDLAREGGQSEILVRSAARPELITGFEVGHVWGDEAGRWQQDSDDPMFDAMLQAEGRLRDPRAQFLQANYTFTHEGDCTAVYRRFEQECDGHPDYAVYRAATTDNPLMRKYAEEKRRNLSPELAGQYLDGKAISRRGGAVYGEFDEGRNVDAGLRLSDAVPLHLAIDFNIDPGMHAIIGQHFPQDDLLTAVHEIHAPRMDVRQMMFALRDLIERDLGGWRWPALWLFGDASGNGKWAGSGQSCWDVVIEALRLAGLPYRLKVPKANPPVADRVNAFNCALQSLDGRTRFKLHPRCKLLARDLKQMRWNHGELDKTDRRLSHAADAEGYRVHWLMPVRPFVTNSRRSSVGFSD
jgi:hypothetical protein